jgi:hypothetical protein
VAIGHSEILSFAPSNVCLEGHFNLVNSGEVFELVSLDNIAKILPCNDGLPRFVIIENA